MRKVNAVLTAAVVIWGFIPGVASGQKQNDPRAASFGVVPTSIGVRKFGDRLRSGHCNLNFSGDSLINPCCSSRLFAGFLRTIPVPMSGIILEHRSGGTQDMGIWTNEINVPGAGRAILQPGDPTLFPLSITEGIVDEPRVEYAFTSDLPDQTNLYGMLFMGAQQPNYTDWADWSWVGQPGMTCRMLYYEHERAPAAVELSTFNADVSANLTITTMKTPPGIEGIGWTDIPVERADAASFTDTFGVYLRTAAGYVESGPTGTEGLALLGCRYWIPGRPGVQISTLSYGGSSIENHLDLTHMSDANLAKYVESCQIDTPVLWLADEILPIQFATFVEQWAERMKTAINTARINDPNIQAPMPVIVATWPKSDVIDNINSQPAALASMVMNHPDYVFININRLVQDAHGPWSSWQAAFTLDGLHSSTAGSNEFTQLFFTEALLGGCREDISPPGGNGTVNIDDLVLLINSYGDCPPSPTPCSADNFPPGGDGVVGIIDLIRTINAFGPCP